MTNGRIFKLKVRKTALMAGGNKVINTLKTGAKVTNDILIANDPLTNRLTVFLDTTDKKNAAGLIEEITTGGKAIVQEELKDILKVGYSCKVTELGEEASTYYVEMTELLPENKKGATVSTSDFDDEINRIVNAGYCTETDARERIEVCKALHIPNEIILDILAQYRKYKKPARRPSTIWTDPYDKRKTPIMVDAIINIMINRSQVFEGPKSVGKNVAIETLAWILNKPLYMITFNRYMCGDDIYGTKTTVPAEITQMVNGDLEAMSLADLKMQRGEAVTEEEADMAARFKVLCAKASAVMIQQEDSPFVDAVEDGGVFCANEMNLAEANFLSGIMNQLTDGTGFITAPGRGQVTISPDFTLIATQNAGYAGCNDQNEATMSRFACVNFEFPGSVKSQLEAAVGKDELDKKYFAQCDVLYKELLNAVRQGVVRDNCLNIRGMVAALRAVAKYPAYTKLSTQLEEQVVNTCPAADRPTLMAQIQDKISL